LLAELRYLRPAGVSRSPFVFAFAETEKHAVEIVKKYEGLLVIPSSHGNSNDVTNDSKQIFGNKNASALDFINSMNKKVGYDAMSILVPWFSCNFTKGERTPERIYKEDARDYIIKRIQSMEGW